MRTHRLKRFVLSLLTLVLVAGGPAAPNALAQGPAPAGAIEVGTSGVLEPVGEIDILDDGTVVVDQLHTFADLTEYVQSGYFRTAGKRCGTRLSLLRATAEAAAQSDCSLSQTVIKSAYWPAATVLYYVPVVFHVIHKTDGTGDISNQAIYDQVEVLNEDYGALSGTLGENGVDVHIRFVLAGITRTEDNQWFRDLGELQYKEELGWNQTRYLNIYVNSARGYLGYSYYPQDVAGETRDGVTLLYEAVGGRDNGFGDYDQGRTAVHEIGHYMGLLHPFEGSVCQNGYQVADLINDTRPEDVEHYYCPTSAISCGVQPNIRNYMNYTDDSCMQEFTREQANRMVCALLNYRPFLARAAFVFLPTVRK